MSATSPPSLRPRGIDFNLPTCGETQCHGHGNCMVSSAGGGDLVCNCVLGYRGEFCEDTVNEAVSVPLTLGVLTVIIGVVILAFIFAKIRQKQKRRQRKEMAARQGYNVAV